VLSKWQFRDQWYTLAPEWLTTGNAERYMYALQTMSDMLVEKAFEAMTIRLPGQGDPSQLPYLAFDRQLVQGPGESNASFVQRLIGSFNAWGIAGSKVAVLQQLQAYLQNLQPGVTASLPQLAIVGGCWATVTTWDTIYGTTPLLAPPTKVTVQGGNFNWDGNSIPWRAWLIVYLSLVPVAGLSGTTGAALTADASACFTVPGQTVAGVYVPATSGTPVNSPWFHLTGLANLTNGQVGQWVTVSGSIYSGNNGTFPIIRVISATECVVANPLGNTGDAGPLVWSIGQYPFLGPGPVWGTPGVVFGQGQASTPPLDTGSNVGGVWQPTTAGNGGSLSWGLGTASIGVAGGLVIASLRALAKAWKSAGTFYQHIVVVFDGGSGAPGSAYSPYSAPGSGNPDGTFGPSGHTVVGLYAPTRQIASPFDCYCQGTGSYSNCSIENVT